MTLQKVDKQEELASPVPDPGMEPHVERFTDVDEAAADRAYRQIVAMLVAVPILAITFVVIYFVVPKEASMVVFGNTFMMQSVLLGVTGGLAALLIGVSAIHWARMLMTDEEIVGDRHGAASPVEVREALVKDLSLGAEQSGIHRRKLLGSGMAGAIGIMTIPALITLADLGPWPTASVRAETIERTIWARGIRVVNDVTLRTDQGRELVDRSTGQWRAGEPPRSGRVGVPD